MVSVRRWHLPSQVGRSCQMLAFSGVSVGIPTGSSALCFLIFHFSLCFTKIPTTRPQLLMQVAHLGVGIVGICWHSLASPRVNCVVLYSRRLWGGCGVDLRTSLKLNQQGSCGGVALDPRPPQLTKKTAKQLWAGCGLDLRTPKLT